MAILKRVGLGRALTHPEMDENFSSVYFSSSLENNGNNLRLYYDTDPITYDEYPLTAGNSIGIVKYEDNRVLTATNSPNTIEAESNFTFDGNTITIDNGKISVVDARSNVLIGLDSGLSFFSTEKRGTTNFFNTTLGRNVAGSGQGNSNTLIGYAALNTGVTINSNVAIGASTLLNLGTGDFNVALGTSAGEFNTFGDGNIYIGYKAGPSETNTVESGKLYINNTVGTPLIGGDFREQTVNIEGALTVSQNINAASFIGSFSGDGSGLTGIPSTGWDGIRNGNARITGSLTVSGSAGTVVNFTGVSAISGSIFSGSFVGNGSGLTGVVADWNGKRNGNAEITGSFIVSGSSPTILLGGVTTVDQNIKIWNPSKTTIGIGEGSFSSVVFNFDPKAPPEGGINSIAIGTKAAGSTKQNYITTIGHSSGVNAGNNTVYVGDRAGEGQQGDANTAIGSQAMSTKGAGVSNTIIGASAGAAMKQVNSSVAVGAGTLAESTAGDGNTAVGTAALARVGVGATNTALGFHAGANIIGDSTGNIYIGYKAGPDGNTVENSKLYISNESGIPLIGGDFKDQIVNIEGGLVVSQYVNAPLFIGSFQGNGANLTNLPASTWNGIRNGNAQITGSLVVSGSGAVVNLTRVAAISGSIFSGSFVGNGSGLTGVNIGTWDGKRNGNAEITGSLAVSGSLLATNIFTITSGSVSSQPGVNMIHIAPSSLSAASTTLYRFPLDATTGYTGFRADYTLTNSSETSKKVGTLLASWNRSGNPILNDSFTTPAGDVKSTLFVVASNSTSASLNLEVTAGTFELNMLITAFKRSI